MTKETCICCNGKGYIVKLRKERTPRATIIKCKELYSQGHSLREIGKKVGIKYAQSVKNLITRKNY